MSDQRAKASNLATSTREFHFFPLLPPELRLKVWAHALPQARIIILRVSKGPLRRGLLLPDWISLTSNPALLSATREARFATLPRFHRLPLQCTGNASRGPIAYVNTEIDVVYISYEKPAQGRHRVSPAVLFAEQDIVPWPPIRYLAFDVGAFYSGIHRFGVSHSMETFVRNVRKMGSLEEVSVMVDSPMDLMLEGVLWEGAGDVGVEYFRQGTGRDVTESEVAFLEDLNFIVGRRVEEMPARRILQLVRELEV